MSVLSSAREVLTEILQCIDRTDPVHYAGMVEALALAPVEAFASAGPGSLSSGEQAQ
jgi:hypothetical protein